MDLTTKESIVLHTRMHVSRGQSVGADSLLHVRLVDSLLTDFISSFDRITPNTLQGVTSVIFLASLSEYDMFLAECKTKNRTEESLQVIKI